MINTSLSRTWFLGHGCKQVPPELIGGKILWAHPDGYFLNARGQKVKHDFGPAKQSNKPYTHGGAYPCMRQFGNKNCHHLMYEAFYGPRTPGMEIDHLNGIVFTDRCERMLTEEEIQQMQNGDGES